MSRAGVLSDGRRPPYWNTRYIAHALEGLYLVVVPVSTCLARCVLAGGGH
jgi:hypothetical protein